MTETAEPVANDDKRGDGKKSEFEAQYLSNASTAANLSRSCTWQPKYIASKKWQ